MKQRRNNRKKSTGANAAFVLCVCVLCWLPGARGAESDAWKRLESTDRNERRTAMEEAYATVAGGGTAAFPEEAMRAVRNHAGRWEENSDKAILVLGLEDDRAAMPLVRAIWTECGRVERDPLEDRLVLAPRIRKACVMALCRMGDAEAEAEVERLLDSDNPAEAVEGIECAAYSGTGRYTDRLAVLLGDGRDAVNVAPSGAFYWLRVCDFAANALVEALPVSASEGIQPGVRWEDWQLKELKNSIGNSDFARKTGAEGE